MTLVDAVEHLHLQDEGVRCNTQDRYVQVVILMEDAVACSKRLATLAIMVRGVTSDF